MGSSTGKQLCGIEVEFGFAARDSDGRQLPTSFVLDLFFDACRDQYVHLPGRDGVRLFLANGALLYPDVGHPELSTPECESPMDLLHALRAGEGLVALIAATVESADGIADLNLYRSNVDYSAIGTTWGCHESYLSRRRPETFAKHVVAHLVSRIVYTGGGGFDNRSFTATFALSPRAYLLSNVVGNDRGGARAIFSLRNESLSSAGYSRVHLVCGEPNCSDLSTYLKVGATALVLAMADAGADFGGLDQALRSPLAAIRTFAADTACAETVQGPGAMRLTALEIQRQYLALAEANVDAAYMPDWAPEVCERWRAVLEALESGPDATAGLLDWSTKLAICKQYVAAQPDLDWDSLPVWGVAASGAFRALAADSGGRTKLTSRRIKACLATPTRAAATLRELSAVLDTHGCTWDEFDAFVKLRNDLCELDLRYGQLYPKGIYEDLAESGRFADGLADSRAVEAAKRRAPGSGRARLRGDWVRELAKREQRYYCDWTSITSLSEHLDLGDPFVAEASWVPNEDRPAQRRFLFSD